MTATKTPERAAGRAAESAQVELILAQIESLPTLPAVATRLLELTSDDTSSAREVVQLIESDQSLAARVLSTVGKASVGATANTVDRAVVLMGFDAVRSLVLSIQIFETFSHRAETDPGRLDRVGFWKHCLAVGCAARLAAVAKYGGRAQSTSTPSVNPEEVFLCGLIHDLGKMVLDSCFPKSYARVIAKVESLRGYIGDVEQEVFGIDHTVAGQRLAVHWKLPAMIQEAIWLHHHSPESTPTRITHPEHVRMVQVADRLVRLMRIGYSGNHSTDGPLEVIGADAGLSREEMDRIAAALPGLIEARAELIGLDRLTSTDVYHEALAETNAELARVNRSLALTNRRLEERARCFEALRALNAGLNNEPAHEDVCRAAAGAAQLVAGPGPVAVFGLSARRAVLVIGASDSEADWPQVRVLPASSAGDALSTSGLASGWLRVSTLPGPLVDSLVSALGKPPAWYWPVGHQHELLGAIVSTLDSPPGADESMAALSDALGLWLSGAESRTVTRQLNEELAEINRRLVGSRAELTRIRSLAMLGEMAAGAAHELNNPLAVISGRAQMLNRDDLPDEVQRTTLRIAENAHRASAIVAELMDFAKPTPPVPTEWPIAESLAEVRREWIEKSSLTEGQFHLELSDDVPNVRADASQIKRLFDEVICNAVEAMGEVSEPRLIVNCEPILADDRVVIKLQDNGCGMTADVLERATAPFFSHRPAGRGRGLGLSRAARYAEINGGRIRLSSEVGEGTVVFVELPAGSAG